MTGALTGGQVGPVELLQQRLRCGQVREALGILKAMDWSIMGDECCRGLSSITNHLLRLELNAEREGRRRLVQIHITHTHSGFNRCIYSLYVFLFVPVAYLEAALGVFYAPAAPLSDVVILGYREPVSKYARRFFHHLLR